MIAYSYQLSNGHYVVNIDGLKYLLDTGVDNSFHLSKNNIVNINNKDYHLSEKPSYLDLKPTFDLIGEEVDGFIGLDILKETSLTIYKNGIIVFDVVDNVEGEKINLNTYGYLSFDTSCNGIKGKYIIDLGAKYGYGINELFINKNPYDHVNDYNPGLKFLDSDIYQLDFLLGNKKISTSICKNERVNSLIRYHNGVIIGNITDLYDYVCVIDIRNKKLVIG